MPGRLVHAESMYAGMGVVGVRDQAKEIILRKLSPERSMHEQGMLNAHHHCCLHEQLIAVTASCAAAEMLWKLHRKRHVLSSYRLQRHMKHNQANLAEALPSC